MIKSTTLDVSYRHSPAVEEGRPTPPRGPKAGDRLPDAHIIHEGQVCWVGEAVAGPRFHLLLCGSPGSWDTNRLTAVRSRYAAEILAVHHLTREAAPGVLYDLNGQAFRRLGVTDTAHFLVRPDGHIGYRVDGTDLDGLHGYLDRWLPNSTPHPA